MDAICRRASWVVAVLLGLVLSTDLCRAQISGTEATGGPNPAIPWLHPGLMISSTWAAWYYPGHATDFKQDEHGRWIGSDGQQLTATNRPGTSASGITQSVVSAMGDKLAVICNSSYADVRLLGVRDPELQDFPRTYAIGMEENDMWMAPAKLAQMHSDGALRRVVFPVQWKVGDQIVDAIRIEYVKDDGYLDHVYDRRSGLCLHAGSSSTGAAPELKYVAPGESNAGDTLLSDFEFISIRDTHAPWANEPMPPITGQFKSLHYTGQMQLPRMGFSVPKPTPLTLDITRKDIGKDWVSLDSTAAVVPQGQIRLPPTKQIFICGQDQYATFFAGTNALAKLQTGQALDTDPLTKVQTTVADANGNSVTIRSASAGTDIQRTYDRQIGKLIGIARTDAISHIRTAFQLQSEE